MCVSDSYESADRITYYENFRNHQLSFRQLTLIEEILHLAGRMWSGQVFYRNLAEPMGQRWDSILSLGHLYCNSKLSRKSVNGFLGLEVNRQMA